MRAIHLDSVDALDGGAQALGVDADDSTLGRKEGLCLGRVCSLQLRLWLRCVWLRSWRGSAVLFRCRDWSDEGSCAGDIPCAVTTRA